MAQIIKGQKTPTTTKHPPRVKAASADNQSISKRANHASSKIENLVTSRLLALPAELRDEIYKLVLVNDNGKNVLRIRPWPGKTARFRSRAISKQEMQKWEEPALLRACKSIRNQASAIYFGSHGFEVTLHLREFEYVATWLRTIIARCEKTPTKHLNLYVFHSRWRDLKYIRPLVELCYQTEIKLECRPLSRTEQPGSIRRKDLMSPWLILHFSDKRTVAFQRAIEEAMDLGKKARKEGWHEDRLEVEFGIWLEEKLNTGRGKKTATNRRWQHLRVEREFLENTLD